MKKRLLTLLLCASMTLASISPVYADDETPAGETVVESTDTDGSEDPDPENSVQGKQGNSGQDLKSKQDNKSEETNGEQTLEVTVEGKEESISVDEDEFDMSNDELFQMYAAQELGMIPGGISTFSLNYAAANLGEGTNEYKVYQSLMTQIKAVANGERDNAEFTVPVSEILAKTTYTAAELGVSTMFVNGSISSEVKDKLSEMVQVDFRSVMNALLCDCPYELYWFSKAEEGSFSYGFPSYRCYTDSANPKGVVSFEDQAYTISMIVDEPYRSDSTNEYSVDKAKTGAAKAAAANAQLIVDAAKSKSDYEKLKYYKDEICRLVSYDHECIKLDYTGDISPWQIINTFDNNPETNVVCEGYAKSFAYLCELTDFNSDEIMVYTVTGDMGGGTGAGPHMWNVAHMDDGNNYLVDVTNCDEGTIGYSDELFLKKRGSELVSQSDQSMVLGYSYIIKGNQIYFVYDSDTLYSYDFDSELKLSGIDYVEPTEVTKVDSEITGGSDSYSKYVGAKFSLGLDGHKKGSPTEKVTIKYSSSNDEVATVSETGLVTITGEGSATITATIDDSYSVNGCSREISITSSYLSAPSNNTIKYNGGVKKTLFGPQDFQGASSVIKITADGGYTVAEVISGDYVLPEGTGEEGFNIVRGTSDYTAQLRFKNEAGEVTEIKEISIKCDMYGPTVTSTLSVDNFPRTDDSTFANGYYQFSITAADSCTGAASMDGSGITDCYLFMIDGEECSKVVDHEHNSNLIDCNEFISRGFVYDHVHFEDVQSMGHAEFKIGAEQIDYSKTYHFAIFLKDAVGNYGFSNICTGKKFLGNPEFDKEELPVIKGYYGQKYSDMFMLNIGGNKYSYGSTVQSSNGVEGVWQFAYSYLENIYPSVGAQDRIGLEFRLTADSSIVAYQTEAIAEVKYLNPSVAPVISGENKGDWYTGDITVTAPDGYLILDARNVGLGYYDFMNSSDWVSSFIYSEGLEGPIEYYLKCNTYAVDEDGVGIKGAISDKLNIEVQTDTQGPSASISVDGNKWDTFLDAISFDTYFAGTKEVKIAAADSDSGLASIGYKLSGEAISRTDIESIIDSDWETVTCNGEKNKTISFNIEPGSQYVVYVKIEDKSGHKTYISSNGLVTEKEPRVESTSLTIDEGSIGINFYLADVPDSLAGTGSVFINNKKYNFSAKESDGTYKFTYGVNAKEIADKLTVEVRDGRNVRVNLTNESAENGIIKYSVSDYINNCESDRDLLEALDTYGMCARKYFKYNAPVEKINVAECNLDGFVKVKNGALPNGVAYVGSTLVLKDTMKIRHYFKMNKDVEGIIVKIGDENVDLMNSDDGLVYAEISGIKSSEMETMYDLKVSDTDATKTWDLKYCVLSYAYDAVQKSANVDLCNLVKSIYWYNCKAKERL